MTDENERSTREQLQQAARDLWSMPRDVGDDYIVFFDRRGKGTRVERTLAGTYRVSWEVDEAPWQVYEREFENPREAAFHGFQGPH